MADPKPKQQQQTDPRFDVGCVIGEKYSITRVIGWGGMSTVFEALHLQLGDRVALKVLAAELAGDDEFVARFLREGRAVARLRSEHVARVYDVGTLPDGLPYLVMEYLEGKDLSWFRRKGEVLSIANVVDYVLQAGLALAEAHSKGIVHRDVKPSNLFLTTRADNSSCVKILDFGVSKLKDIDSDLTDTDTTIGTPSYMSPEQLHSARDIDARSDIWSLGVVIFELLTRTRPFQSLTNAGLVLEIVQKPPRSLATLRPDTPSGLIAAVECCLEKDRDRRFSSLAQLAIAIAPYGSEAARLARDGIVRTLDRANPSQPELQPLMKQTLRIPPPSPSDQSAAAGGSLSSPDAVAPNTVGGWGSGRRLLQSVPHVGYLVLASILFGLLISAVVVTAVLIRRPRVTSQPIDVSTSTTPSDDPSAGIIVAIPTPSTVPSASASAEPVVSPSASSSVRRPVPPPPPPPSQQPKHPKPTPTIADDRHG